MEKNDKWKNRNKAAVTDKWNAHELKKQQEQNDIWN